MSMKGLILSGGAGTRLRPITHTSAKQLVPVANKPILFYGLEAMAEAGIGEVGIIIGETGEEIRSAAGDGSAFGLRITYIEQEAPLGLAHAVLIARDFLAADPFVMYLGDNILKEGVVDLVARFESENPNSQILLAKVTEPERFGVAELEGDRIVRLVEKPPDPPSDLALVGVYMFDETIHEAVRAIEPSPRGELEITDAIQWLIDDGRDVRPHLISGWWKDTGRLEDLLEANRLILETVTPAIQGNIDEKSDVVGRVTVQEGAEIVDSVIRGPAIIGRNSKVVRSFIGPFTSIYEDCEVIDSEVEHSVILENCKIKSIGRIEDSLLGNEVIVEQGPQKPAALRLMLGDHSRLSLP